MVASNRAICCLDCHVEIDPGEIDAKLDRLEVDDIFPPRQNLELEALHGHASRLGERLGVPTPAAFAIYAALQPHAAGRRG